LVRKELNYLIKIFFSIDFEQEVWRVWWDWNDHA